MDHRENSIENQEGLLFHKSVDLTFLMAVEEGRYRFITVNDAFLNAAGLRREQVDGKYADQVIPEAKYPAIVAKYQQAIEERQTIQWEDTSDYHDGRRTSIVSVTPVFNEQDICTLLVGTLHDITERKRKEDALRSREKQLDLIYNTVGDIIFLISLEPGPRYRFTSVNNAFLHATGLTKGQIEGRYAEEIIPPQSLPLVLANYQQAIAEKKTIQWEETSAYPAGEKTGIVSITPVFNDKGECTSLVGAVHDITERKRVQEEKDRVSYLLNERIKELTTLARADQILQEESKPVETVLQQLVAILPPGWQYPEVTEARIRFGDQQFETRRFAERVSSQLAKFHTPDGIEGSIEVAYITEKPPDAEGPFLVEERSLINMLAEKLRVYFARKGATEQLRKEKEWSDKIIETLPGIFYLFDDTGKYLRWNKNHETVPGYTTEEMQQMHPLKFFEGDEQRLIQERIAKVFTEGYADAEAGFLHKDGKKTPHYFNGVSIQFEGKTCLMGMGIDITERKKVEERNRKNEERFRVLVDSAPDATVIVDEAGIIQMVNKQTEVILGYHRDELVGKPVEVLIPGDLHEKHRGYRDKYHKETRTREMGMGMELFAVKKNGVKIPVEISLAPFHSEEGTQVIASIRDITERKKAAEQIQKEKALSDRIIETLPGIFYLFDDQGKYLRWNRNHEKVTGYSAAEMAHMIPLDFFGEEEHEKIRRRMKQVLTEGYAEDDAVLISKEGKKIPFYFNGISIMYEGKRCIMGVGIDITERKKMENELREAEIKFRTLAEKSMVGVYIVQKAKFAYVNPRFAEIFGYTQEEMIDMDPLRAIVTEEYRDIVNENVRLRLEGEVETLHYEIKGIRKDGSLNWVEFFGSMAIYEGKPSIIGTMVDITERKMAEEALLKSEANLQTVFDATDTIYILLDDQKRVVSFNQRARNYVQQEMNKSILINSKIVSYYPADRRPLFEERMDRVLKGEHISYESSFVQPDGSYHWFHVRMYPIMHNDQRIIGLIKAISDITEKKILEQKILNQKVEEQKKMTRAVLNAQEKERNYIGQELHDNVNQILVGAKMFLGLAKGNNKDTGSLVEKTIDLLDNAINEIRELTREQVTPQKKIELKDLLQSLIDKLNEHSPIKASLQYDTGSLTISDDLKLNIYRIVQEGLNNILKHASAKNASVSVKVRNNTLHVQIADDGKGFDVSRQVKGIGVANILNRVESYNGQIAIDSAVEKGCRIELAIPL